MAVAVPVLAERFGAGPVATPVPTPLLGEQSGLALVFATDDELIYVDADDGALRRVEHPDLAFGGASPALVPVHKWLIVVPARGGAWRYPLDLSSKGVSLAKLVPDGFPSVPRHVSASDRGAWVALDNGAVMELDLHGGVLSEHPPPDRADQVTVAAVSRFGLAFDQGSGDSHSIGVRDLATGRTVGRIGDRSNQASLIDVRADVVASRQCGLALVATHDPYPWRCDVMLTHLRKSQEQRVPWPLQSIGMGIARLSPDGRRLAVISYRWKQSEIDRWSTGIIEFGRAHPFNIEATTRGFKELAWSPDGRWLLWGADLANDGFDARQVRAWRVGSGEPFTVDFERPADFAFRAMTVVPTG